MAKLCLCLTASTISEDLETLEAYRGRVDLAELRADFLLPDEQYFIRSFPEKAGLPVILTVRRPVDGGLWREGEGSRMVLLAKGLSFADPDPRKNFAYVDLEDDLRVPAVEEAARAFGTRIIRSRHEIHGTPSDCEAILRTLPHHPDEIPKLAINPLAAADSTRLFKASAACGHAERVVLGMGERGFWTRVLPDRLGSFLTYASAGGKAQAARGHVDPDALLTNYRFRSIGSGTRIYAVAGRFAADSSLTGELNAALTSQGEDAVFVPFPCESLPEFLEFAQALGLAGAVLLMPLRIPAAEACAWTDHAARASGSVSLILRGPGGWRGYDADSPCIREALKAVVRRSAHPFMRGAVLGAGSMAEAAIHTLRELHVPVIVTERSMLNDRAGRPRPGVAWAGPEAHVLKAHPFRHTFFVKTARVSSDPEQDDPLPGYVFSGRESLLDLDSGGQPSRLALRAAEAGCSVRDSAAFCALQARRILEIASAAGAADA